MGAAHLGAGKRLQHATGGKAGGGHWEGRKVEGRGKEGDGVEEEEWRLLLIIGLILCKIDM